MTPLTTIKAIPWIILILWFIRTIRVTLWHVYFWQLKEYRLDRFFDHLRLKRARQKLFSKLWWARVIMLFIFPGLAIAYHYAIISQQYAELALNMGLVLIPIFFLVETIETAWLLSQRCLKRPIFTGKAVLIVSTTIFSQIGLLLGYFFWIYKIKCRDTCEIGFEYFIGSFLLPWLLTFLLPITVFILVLCFKPITALAKYYFGKKAKHKISQLKNLTVIGITGSFGKTSTKEFLYTILSKKYNVLKTDQHVNTEIGVAQTVLKKLKPDQQIFIVEMGAYKRGEIKTICDIVKPKIGILTGINEQHISLFGSLTNIKKGKYELIESLPKNGLAIFNGDNEHARQLAEKTKIKKLIFSTEHKADVYADQIDIKPNKLSFLLYHHDNCRKVKTQLVGRQNIANILAAASAALHFGLTMEEIAEASKELKPIDKTMTIIEVAKDITIIDDSYNANPDGVIAAIDHLNIFPPATSKVIIMPSMLELGKKSPEAHQRVGQKIGQVCDLAIFLDNEEINNLSQGIKQIKPSKNMIFQENNPDKILNIISQHIKKPAVILFESRGAERVIDRLKNL